MVLLSCFVTTQKNRGEKASWLVALGTQDKLGEGGGESKTTFFSFICFTEKSFVCNYYYYLILSSQELLFICRFK
jgi:hypothetical protein